MGQREWIGVNKHDEANQKKRTKEEIKLISGNFYLIDTDVGAV